MKLIPRELDKLVLSQAGALAQRRLARGVRLNYPEAVALIASQARLSLIANSSAIRSDPVAYRFAYPSSAWS
jgi:urease gamma subunit